MMTMIADDGYMDCSTTGDWYVDGDDVDISMDVHQFLGILEEDPLDRDPSLSNHGHFSSVSTEKDGPAVKLENHENSFFQIDASQSSAVVDLNIRDCMASSGNSSEGIEASENPVFRSPFEISSVKVNEPSVSGSSTSFGVHNSSDFVNMVPDIPQWWSDYDVSAQFPDENLLHSTDFNFMLTNEDMMHDMNNFNACLGSNMVSEAQVGGAYSTASDAPFYGLFGSGHELVFDGVYPAENVGTNTYDSIHSTNSYKASAQQFVHTQICKSSDIQAMKMKDEGVDEQLSIKGIRSQSFEVKDEGRCGEFCLGSSAGNSSDSTVTLMPGMKSFRDVKYEKNYQFAAYGEGHCSQPLVSFDKSGRMNGELQETISKPVSVRSDLAKVGLEESGSNSSDCRNDVANDADICIIEDTSPKRGISSAALGKCLATPHRTICTSSFSPVGVGGSRLKATNENQIFRAALKDLSQPKSEATPPDGLLAVPLLKHQRIALSWMVQKETGLRCSGGILADDQGLGKTVSTIALILKERPPSARMSNSRNKCEPETLDLENDDLQVNMLKKDDKHMTNGSSMRSVEGSSSTKGRPAAGTLIVCPTSVLRQWAEELRTKVTSQANLSVLVYHGSNRLKDPYELAKYDVVLTTYSIVSMEVPKQPLVLKDGDEKRKLEAFNDPSLMSSKKRKHQATSEKACVRKGMENVLLESGARPLAKVGWFRVVLDEAQCIKNYRTQVAQACWGLRAKRRWCLSGTPIQNAVDDLYSYFRFLRYDPYAVYKSFCSMVKNPISRNPASGYRKLQAVLKTVMLRRTKGTLLDGEPIITLPPKSVILKKVEFSEKERDFYSQLEADSRAQFQEYAASGTVQQNYVNILLMLLRLRQACDHPLLVKGYDYSSNRNFSINVARNLPREQLISLLNCLEASLAICGICNDPPEDAVVSICGHVFCNQCICEHISGDDSQCPAMNCKVQINVSLVFSRATLRGCLSDQSGHCISLSSLGSDSLEQTEMVESSPDSSLFGSSKITAALEVLRSLANPQEHGLDKARYVVSSQSSSSDTPSRTDSGSCVEKNGLSNSVLAGREKAIVFSQWTGMLDLLEARLKESSIQYRRLDGTMTVCARDKAVKDFNTLPEVSVMIMSLKAASLGLNMVAACHVLLLDLWWNPTTEDQAIDRAHRIGQTRPVTVLRLTVKDTVEDRILALQQKKREMVASAFGEDEKGRRQTRLTVEDLKYLFMCDNGAFST